MTSTPNVPADQIAMRGYIYDMLQDLLRIAESRRLDDVATSIRSALVAYPSDLEGED